jgi:hypothetical protein
MVFCLVLCHNQQKSTLEEPMNELPSESVPEAQPDSVFQIWWKALSKPSELTYAAIASSPAAKATTAYLWVFIAGLVQFLLSALVQRQMMNNLRSYGLDLGDVGSQGGISALLIGMICIAPIGAAIATLFFALWVAIVQWLARMFGGTGNYDQLAYALGAIIAPYSILTGILTLFSAIPYAGLCFNLVLILAGLYIIVLQVMAIKGVNRTGWGGAIGAFLIPGLVLGFICACLFGVSLAALIPLMRQSFPNFQP